MNANELADELEKVVDVRHYASEVLRKEVVKMLRQQQERLTKYELRHAEQRKRIAELESHPVKELTISIVDIDNLIDQFWYSDDAGFHFHYYDFASAILRKAQEK